MFEYLEDTRETSHGVRGSRSGMPANIMARMEDGVIEPKSVLQIFVVSAQESPVARAIIERVWNLCVTCRLLRMTLRGQKYAYNLMFLFSCQFVKARAHESGMRPLSRVEA